MGARFFDVGLATSIKNRVKIHEKSHVFGDLDFGRVVIGFLEGVGIENSSPEQFGTPQNRAGKATSIRLAR